MSTLHDHLGGMGVLAVLLSGSTFGWLADQPDFDRQEANVLTVDRYVTYLVGPAHVKITFPEPATPNLPPVGLALAMERDGYRVETITSWLSKSTP